MLKNLESCWEIQKIKRMKNKVIAIDGYSSCGKSTLAKALAQKTGFTYVDSGAMYRAVTLYFLRNQISLTDQIQIQEALENIHIDLVEEQGGLKVFLNHEDISEEIRQMKVSEFVSEVSAIKLVRKALVAQQQALGKRRNIIMDGRDIGTTVFPHADLKIFMTAEPQIRANRRFQELRAKGIEVSMEEVIENLAHRDHIDTHREESPLVRAADAFVLDNSDITEAEQLAIVLEKISNI